jgi:glycosyltransferase involved in cell wall biosynthesis
VAETARNLAALGYEVDVFTRRDEKSLPVIKPWGNGIRIINVPAGPPTFIRKEDLLPHMREFTAFLVRFCKMQWKPYDLMHANFWMSGLVAADLKKRLGIPFVVTFHALGRVRRFFQGEADLFPDERFSIEERIIAEADEVIAECPQDQDDLVSLYGADPANVTIVPCGVDLSEFFPISKPVARVALGLIPEEHIVLQLGRLVARKGIDNVVRAHGRLVREHGVTARLLIVGGDSDQPDPEATPEIGRLQCIAEQERVADLVTFVGRREREALKYFYSAADVFVTTPWYEPFGITPLEAMACGTPVIGSDVGGIKYTVIDREVGYLVPPDSPDTLAERIAHLYRNPRLSRSLGQRGIKRVNDLFTWHKVTASIADVYEEAIQEASYARAAASY